MAESAEPTIALLEYIQRLKRLPRTGWLLAGVTLPESVAGHSFGTALFTCILGGVVNAGLVDASLAGPIDVDRAVRMALIHDLAESKVTDLPHEAAELIGRDAKQAAELAAIRTLMEHVQGGEEYVALWQEYASRITGEAKLVHDADKLEMVMQARHYASAGNANLDEFWQGHEWFYAESRTLFEQLACEAK